MELLEVVDDIVGVFLAGGMCLSAILEGDLFKTWHRILTLTSMVVLQIRNVGAGTFK